MQDLPKLVEEMQDLARTRLKRLGRTHRWVGRSLAMSPRAVVTRARGTPGHRWPGQGCSGGDTPAGEEKSDSGPGHSGDKGKGEDPGIDAGSPEGGLEADGLECGLEADWKTSESDVETPKPKPPADGDKGDKDHEKKPAPELPYTSAADFGFTTENTAKFMGLHSLADVEFFVPVLRLNLDETTQAQLGEVFCQCILQCEMKYGEKLSEEALFKLQQCIHNTRKQVKAAFDRRVAVLDCIRLMPVKKLTNDRLHGTPLGVPRHQCRALLGVPRHQCRVLPSSNQASTHSMNCHPRR